MPNQVLIRHPEGWSTELLLDWRNLASAAERVDGKRLCGDGRLEFVALTFPTALLAASFELIAREYLIDGAEILPPAAA